MSYLWIFPERPGFVEPWNERQNSTSQSEQQPPWPQVCHHHHQIFCLIFSTFIHHNQLPSYKHFQFPSNLVCLFYPIRHLSTAPFIIFHTSPKIEINSARWLLTLQSLCQTVFPWENIDFYPGAKPYFHLFTGRIFFCRKISTLLWACANGRTKMEFSIMAIEEAPRLPAGYTTAAKLCASPNLTSCHFFSSCSKTFPLAKWNIWIVWWHIIRQLSPLPLMFVIFRTSTGSFDALRGRYFPGGPTPPEGMDADMMFKVSPYLHDGQAVLIKITRY